MKKVLAAVLAVLCVAGSMNYVPQKSEKMGSSVVMTADAASSDEAALYPGDNASKYKYTMADDLLYKTAVSEVSNTEWVDAENGNTYSIYKIVITDVIEKAKLSETYAVGLKQVKTTNLDVDMSAKIKYSSTLDENLANSKLFKEGDPLIDTIKGLFDSKTKDASVKVIGDAAFKESYLKTIDLTGVEFIGKSAFESCKYITDVTIPDSVKYVGANTFYKSGLKRVDVKNEMINIPASFCAETNLTEITFAHPDYIRTIGTKAFSTTPIKAPIFSEWGEAKGYELLDVGDNAFEKCTSIKSVEMSDNVLVCGKNAFDTCTSIATVKLGKKTLGIDQECFNNCTSLASVTFNDILIAIGGNCFKSCTMLKSISGLPGTLKDWEGTKEAGLGFGDGVFAYCTSLTDAVLPTSITIVPSATFSGCTKLTSVKYGLPGKEASAAGDNITRIGDEAFSNCTSLPKAEYNNVEKIGTKAFAGSGITSASFPKAALISATVNSIERACDDTKGSSAFEGCTKLETVSIPASQFIGKTSFKGCTALKDFEAGHCLLVQDNAMEGCTAIEEIELLADQYGGDAKNSPDKTNSSYGYIFKDCSAAKKITIYGDNKVKLSAGMFSGCASLEEVGGDISGVSIIGKECFNNCAKLKKINFTALRIIETSGFMNCSALKSISDSGTAINAEDYGDKCFMNCSALDIEVNGIISTIGASAFQNSGVKSIAIDGMVGGTVVIGNSAFADCANLKKATILSPGAHQYNVGTGIFTNCPVLEKAVYQGPIITKNMFQNCPLLKNVETTADIFYENAFLDCASLVSVNDFETTYPKIAKEIDGYAFKNCASLQHSSSDMDTLFKGVGQYTGCTSLTAAIASTLTKGMFQNCTSLNDIVIADDITAVPEACFQNCTSLEDFDFTNIDTISTKAFENSGFKALDLSGVKIAGSAFANCTALEALNLIADSLGDNAFANCTALTDADVDAQKIGTKAFIGNTALETLTLKTEEVGAYAFQGASALNKVNINPYNEYTLNNISVSAFADCPELKSMKILGNPTLGKKCVGFLGANKNANFTLIGQKGSSVEAYADNNGFKFQAVGEDIEPSSESQPSSEIQPTTEEPNIIWGDANDDKDVNMSDVVMVMQAALNPKKYGVNGTSSDRITEKGEKYADVDGKTGLSAGDALLIQKFSLGLLDDLTPGSNK